MEELVKSEFKEAKYPLCYSSATYSEQAGKFLLK